MIFTLTDRSYTPLDAYETSDYLIGSYVGSIIKSLELNIFVKSEHAKDWVEGNYIFCSDSNGYKYWFTIYDANDTHGDTTKKLTCYSGTIDIVSEDANPIAMPVTPQPFSWYFDQIFYDTAITIGINELDGLSRSLEFTSENASNAEMLQYVLNGFDNAEADLAVEISGSIPTKVVLNVFQRLGNSESQTLLSDEDDSVTMLERTGSISGLATCLNTVGSGDDPDNPVTLVGKYYEERDENGELLYYSPTDHERVYSVKGRGRFFVEIPGKTNGEFDGYINRRYQSQASTQDALWSESLAQLKKIDKPSVTYEAGGHINCRLGDTVQIVSNEMKPPVMISARVLEYKFNDDIPEVNEYKFGNYAIFVNGTAGNVYTTNKKPTPSEIGAEPATVYGSNTNGYYIKFADGTLICYGRKALNTVAIVNPWGSWYVSSPSSATYPVTFVGAPASVSVNMENTTGDIAAWLNGLSTTTSFSGYFARGDSGTFKCTMGWIAIGRWK